MLHTKAKALDRHIHHGIVNSAQLVPDRNPLPTPIGHYLSYTPYHMLRHIVPASRQILKFITDAL